MADKKPLMELANELSGAAIKYGIYSGSIWSHVQTGNKYRIDHIVYRESDMTLEVVYAPSGGNLNEYVRFTRPIEQFVGRFEMTHI